MNHPPSHLHVPLKAILDQLDHQDRTCMREGKRIQEAIEEKYSIIQALKNEIKVSRGPSRVSLTPGYPYLQEGLDTPAISSPLRVSCRSHSQHPCIGDIRHWGYADRLGRHHSESLRAVCRLWRKTAFSTPHLWRSISLVGSDFPPSFCQYASCAEHQAFERSLVSWFRRGGKGAPLKLKISWVPHDIAAFIFTIIRKAKLNLQSVIVGRDRSKNLYGGSEDLTYLFPSACHSGVLPLEDIHLYFQHTQRREAIGPRKTFTLTNHLPQL
ncbi:hypothetical protein BKA70DRAFT_1279157 [Coprinopsis sp. MPI-PUGE-AT-0042]|nr:hypothetical protein BKA70DRAFT_1279157 [Coprinopsis sp. MPI-PUGE-AT-0042]